MIPEWVWVGILIYIILWMLYRYRANKKSQNEKSKLEKRDYQKKQFIDEIMIEMHIEYRKLKFGEEEIKKLTDKVYDVLTTPEVLQIIPDNKEDIINAWNKIALEVYDDNKNYSFLREELEQFLKD